MDQKGRAGNKEKKGRLENSERKVQTVQQDGPEATEQEDREERLDLRGDQVYKELRDPLVIPVRTGLTEPPVRKEIEAREV